MYRKLFLFMSSGFHNSFYELFLQCNDNCPLDELSLETELRGPTPRCTTALDECICFCAGGGGVLDIELLCF